MNPDTWRRIEDLFDRARQCPPELRGALLDESCAGEPEIRAEVESLLQACEAEQSPLDAQGTSDTELLSVGPYRVVDVLGVGGMGTVYLAEQRAPVKRQVALKVIKLGMDSSAVMRRFEVERQALAMMNHDNIAKVFEAGTTERGQPYFVMEHVPGAPISNHCDEQRLGTRERIELFRQVCAGVQHAHQKGIIHRDLKPSNVLVATDEQGRTVPKIIDFGLARATDRGMLDDSMLTEQGLTIGTPEFMSPEQIDISDADIDTRTDIYSLGVMLYQILTGSLPFSKDELRSHGLVGLQKTIREVEPPRPSTRLTTTGDGSRAAAAVAGLRKTTVLALLKDLRRDLDWIVLQAMAKDRNRRYATAAELAYDLERFLLHEPVRAGPPSTAYRLGKYFRRYRTQVVAGAVVLLSLIGGLIGVALFALEADRQRDIVQKRIDEFDLLAAVVELDRVREEEKELYPAWPAMVTRMQAWLDVRARPSLSARQKIEETLEALANRGLAKSTEQFLHRELSAHLAQLTTFERDVVRNVETRIDWANQIEQASVHRFAKEWSRARDEARSSAKYRDHPFDLEPQLGLVPLGLNPNTGLLEFHHLRSAAPGYGVLERGTNGEVLMSENVGIVFVLVPGGRFLMGAQRGDPKSPNYDELAVESEETPIHEVTLEPFFIARHEVTQAQWARLHGGVNPSFYNIGTESENVPLVTGLHPVENVSWLECDERMRQLGLTLPTEAQWEYAARAGTDTPWWTGRNAQELDGATNLADESLVRALSSKTPCWPGFDDGYAVHAPVSIRRPNDWGLHFVHGNVWEWCLDSRVPYTVQAASGTGLRSGATGDRSDREKVHRGGCYADTHEMARSSRRNFVDEEQRTMDIGLRASRRLR